MLNSSLIRRLILLPLLALPVLLSSPGAAAPHSDVSLRADPVWVSPNGDGIQDQAFFYPVLSAEGGVTRWRLDIDNDKTGRITRLSGAGMPALIMWDLLDRKGAISKDGAYHARFEVWGRVGHLSNEDRFIVDTVPPRVALTVSTAAAGMPITFRPTISDSSPLERWQLQILDETGKTVSVSWSTAAVASVDWDGRDRQRRTLLPSGRYRAAFQAWDVAGNGSEPVFADVAWVAPDEPAPRDDLKRISIRGTKAGEMVSLASEDLFGYSHGRIGLIDAAEVPLSEVAAWVNGRPSGSIILEGYSNAYRNEKKDRDLGSRYAWLVYSRLVKDDDVKASRIRVEGHGQLPSDRSRSAGIPVLRNGVEIWLLDDSAASE